MGRNAAVAAMLLVVGLGLSGCEPAEDPGAHTSRTSSAGRGSAAATRIDVD
jgi:hypothetical protein